MILIDEVSGNLGNAIFSSDKKKQNFKKINTDEINKNDIMLKLLHRKESVLIFLYEYYRYYIMM
jgi:hypothetical protein